MEYRVKSGPPENSLADFCTSTLLKALNINLFYPNGPTKDGKAFRHAEVQRSARKFSHGLHLSQCF